MSLYDDASLIMFPSGYKEDKIYSLKPTDGSGDLTFTRASTATRVNAEGLIETSPVNLVEYSEDFSNAVWTTSKSNATVTSNDATAPNGTLTADKVVFTSNGYLYYATNNFSPLDIPKITVSIYTKTTTQSIILGGASISGTDIYSYEDAGNGWYRQILTRTFTTSSTGYLQILPNGSNETKYFYGAQLNIGSTAKPYFPTTDRLNVPRIDYTGGGCGSLLLEPQRTNFVTYSEQMDNAAWTKSGVDVTANNTTSPDGTTNADKLANQVGATGYLSQTISLSSSTIYTTSVFAKNAGIDNLFIYLSGSGGNANSTFNLTTLSTTPSAGVTAKIENYGNGWYRCSATFTASTTGASGFRIYPSFTNGNGTDGIYIYGAMLEQGSYPTSYIPTAGAATTRIADACNGAGTSATFNSAEGVLMAEIAALAKDGTNKQISINDGSNLNRVSIILNAATNGVVASTHVGGSDTDLYVLTTNNVELFNKFAYKYKANDFSFWINGFKQTATISGGSVPTANLSQLDFDKGDGAFDFYGKTKQLQYYPTALTDLELETLTSFSSFVEMANAQNYTII